MPLASNVLLPTGSFLEVFLMPVVGNVCCNCLFLGTIPRQVWLQMLLHDGSLFGGISGFDYKRAFHNGLPYGNSSKWCVPPAMGRFPQ